MCWEICDNILILFVSDLVVVSFLEVNLFNCVVFCVIEDDVVFCFIVDVVILVMFLFVLWICCMIWVMVEVVLLFDIMVLLISWM